MDASISLAFRPLVFSVMMAFEQRSTKLITFDCGKEFSNWKSISNAHDIDIFFTDPGCPGQRGLNEHSNGLLRRNGLPKQMDFTNISQNYESGTEIGHSLEFDFVIPAPHS